MQILRRIHLALAWAFVAGVVVQVFLAGLGVFDSPERFEVHRTWGYTLELLPILLLVLAAAGRLGRRQLIYPAALFGMFILQSVFVALRTDMPMVAALHPVNGFGILLVGVAMAREAWLTRDATVGERARIAPAASGTASD
jgi:hypothetical protein